MSINSESDRAASLVIGPTSLGMVRIYVEAEGIELPMDFEPDEALEIADELRAAARQATAVAETPKHRSQDHGDRRGAKGAPEHGAKGAPKHGAKGAPEHGAKGAPEHGAKGAPEHGAKGAPEHGAKGAPEHGAKGARKHGAKGARKHGGGGGQD